MAHEMQSFEHMVCERSVPRHTVVVDGVPWLRAKDVAAALDYANPRQTVRHNVDEEDRAQLKDLSPQPGRGLLEHNEGPGLSFLSRACIR